MSRVEDVLSLLASGAFYAVIIAGDVIDWSMVGGGLFIGYHRKMLQTDL